MKVGAIPALTLLLGLFSGGLTALAAGGEPSSILPSRFYVVREVTSDASPFWFTYILDVQPSGTGSLVRCVRVAPFRSCSRAVTVRLAEVRLDPVTPAMIVGSNNPCAVSPKDLLHAVDKHRRTPRIFDTAAYGIVAECDGHERVLHLPYPEEVSIDRLSNEFPAIRQLWNLSGRVSQAAFGTTSPFSNLTPEQDWEYQLSGQPVVDELRAGRFDKGFHKGPKPRKLLAGYHGPYKASCTVYLDNPKAYRFAFYTDPTCPPEVSAGLAWGYVQLELTLNLATGEVMKAESKWGDPRLAKGAVETAQKWRFVSSSLKSDKMVVGIYFGAACS